MGGVNGGSNVIVGAHSVVMHDIPDNTVVAGNPASRIMSLDEYYIKKKDQNIQNAVYRARFVMHQINKDNKKPKMNDMGWFNVLWLDRTKESESFLRSLSFKSDNIDEAIKTFYSTEKI